MLSSTVRFMAATYRVKCTPSNFISWLRQVPLVQRCVIVRQLAGKPQWWRMQTGAMAKSNNRQSNILKWKSSLFPIQLRPGFDLRWARWTILTHVSFIFHMPAHGDCFTFLYCFLIQWLQLHVPRFVWCYILPLLLRKAFKKKIKTWRRI